MLDNILFSQTEELLNTVPTSFHRYIVDEIDWSIQMIGIVGPRGVGKSTMILQRLLKQKNDATNKSQFLYISADDTYFALHSIKDLADEFVKYGGSYLYIDEIHKYPGWSQELKQIYDIHRKLHVVVTGSSVLDIHKGSADLSRRMVVYNLQGLSFREFLHLYKGIQIPPFCLDDILKHNAIIKEIEHPLPLLHEYLAKGYYPFSLEGGFEIKIKQIIAQTLEVDIPQYAQMKMTTSQKLKKMLVIVSQLSPFKPNVENLAVEIGVSKNNVSDYLLILEKAQMIGQLRDDTGGIRGLGKIEKIYIDNPNLMTVLASGTPDIGNIRETFFYNQMRVRNDVISSKESDFCIGQYTFEVGGKRKGKKQIENVSNGIIVKDNIEYGSGITIPLWTFGLNY